MKLGVFVSDYAMAADTVERLKAEKLGLILVMNGVYHATIKGSALLDKTPHVYALAEDLQTRGIAESDVDKRVKVVNYDGLVDVMFNEFEKLAWV